MEKEHKYSARFKEVRDTLGLTQQQLADQLLLSRNYIAKIETGRKVPSMRAVNALESLLVYKENNTGEEGNGFVGLYGAKVAVLEGQLRAQFDKLITAAKKDPSRLIWVREQMASHLSVPDHWIDREELIRQTLEAERKLGIDRSGKGSTHPGHKQTA